MEQLKLSKKKIYGASAEKIAADYGQINFFNEAEAERTPMLPEPKIEDVIKKSHKKKKRSTKEIYKNLEVVEKVYELSKEEQICPKCDSEMTFMRWEIRNEIKIIPAKAQLIVHKKAVYVCKSCDKNGIEGTFKYAKSEPSLIEKSLVSPSLMAYILNQKFCLGLPLYRQEQELKRIGISLSSQTMSNWTIAGAKLLKPLYEALHQNLVSRSILHADETPLEVLSLPGRDKPLNAYMWVYRTSRNEEHPIVLYDYEEGRAGGLRKRFPERIFGVSTLRRVERI
ncbi:MAG: transposase [Ruminococcus sp.]|nr:transposase [Ruminococcus sp.]